MGFGINPDMPTFTAALNLGCLYECSNTAQHTTDLRTTDGPAPLVQTAAVGNV